jgi:LacI family transcriptional regulator
MSKDDAREPVFESPVGRMSAEAVSEMLRRGQAVTDEVRERALHLASGRSGERPPSSGYPRVIGAVITTGLQPDLRHPFFSEVLEGVKERAVAGRYDLILFSGHATDDFVAEFSYVSRCRRHNIDGVILMGVGRTDPELVHLLEEGVPTVAVDLDLIGSRAGYVTSENVESAAAVVQYLHALGYERIAHISGIMDTLPGTNRVLGYRSGLEREKLPFRDEYLVEGDFYEPSGFAAMRRLLALEKRPEAVFCASDMSALGAIRAAHEEGLGVPEDVAVVGFDDDGFAAVMEPGLTTVRQDKAGLGASACEALMRIIETDEAEPPVAILSTELIVRESCGAALLA